MEDNKKYWILIVLVFVFFMYYKPDVCFIIMGSVFFIIGIHAWVFAYTIKKYGISSFGRVINYESDNDGHTIPIVQYKTKNGKEIIKKPYLYMTAYIGRITTYKNNIYDKVPIVYNPKNPKRFILKEEHSQNHLGVVFITIIGIVLIGVGLSKIFNIISIGF